MTHKIATVSETKRNHAKDYIDGFMTVRKERRQRGGAYWTAYRRQGRRLRKIYLGPSASVTVARLRQVAARLTTRIHGIVPHR